MEGLGLGAKALSIIFFVSLEMARKEYGTHYRVRIHLKSVDHHLKIGITPNRKHAGQGGISCNYVVDVK